jgi:hypothetical protein
MAALWFVFSLIPLFYNDTFPYHLVPPLLVYDAITYYVSWRRTLAAPGRRLFIHRFRLQTLIHPIMEVHRLRCGGAAEPPSLDAVH